MRPSASVHFLILSLATLTVFVLQSPAATGKQLTADHVFAPDHLLDVQIDLPESDWDTIRSQSRSFVESLSKERAESPFTYVKGNVTVDGVLIEDVGIRKKGFLGSLDEKRPSLKIKFSEYKKQKPIPGLGRLTLNNNKQDGARLCQYLAYKLYNESGTIAPRCNFAKVTVNGKYLGIYSNVESIKRPFLERTFGDGSGGLFEGTVTDFYGDWVRKFEKKNKQANYDHLYEISKLLEVDDVDLDQLEQVLDVEAFVRFWAMESLIGFWDGYCNNQNNFFIYRNPSNARFYFIPWGTDSAFSEMMPLPPYRIRPRSVHGQAVLPNKLYRIPEIQELYETTLMSFLDRHWNEPELLAEIDRVENLLKAHIHQDNRRFSRTLRGYRKFIQSRRQDLMDEFENGPPRLRSRERMPTYFGDVGKATVTFSAVWHDEAPESAVGLGQVEIDLEIDGKQVELQQAGAFAAPSKWPSPDDEQPPSIVIMGNRKSDGTRLTLGTGVSDQQFRPTVGEPVQIGGVLLEGKGVMNFIRGLHFIGGTVKLDDASVDQGAPVKGTMELTIVKMKGGKPVKELRTDEKTKALEEAEIFGQ